MANQATVMVSVDFRNKLRLIKAKTGKSYLEIIQPLVESAYRMELISGETKTDETNANESPADGGAAIGATQDVAPDAR